MSDGYRIICAGPYRVAEGHRHIANFGIGKQSDSIGTKWTKDAIHDALHAGRRFYIVDGAGIEVAVVPYSCPCGVKTVKLSTSVRSDDSPEDLSSADLTEDLSSVLPSCRWCDPVGEASPLESCRTVILRRRAAAPTPSPAQR